MENYPDEISARQERDGSLHLQFYNQCRPRQALFNFAPAHVHGLNNQSVLLQKLIEMKRKSRERRKTYWVQRSQERQPSMEGGGPGKGQSEIVDPGAYTEEIFDREQPEF